MKLNGTGWITVDGSAIIGLAADHTWVFLGSIDTSAKGWLPFDASTLSYLSENRSEDW